MECGLPNLDITAHLSHFILAKRNQDIIGVVGLEAYGKIGLLRSLAVHSDFRYQGIAKQLFTRMVAYAHLRGVKELFLLTTTAKDYFIRLGFREESREVLPDKIRATQQFKNLCPATAVSMVKIIDQEIQYFPREVLRLTQDFPGVNMWGIGLDKVMMTFFEIEPNKRFEKHNHQSEQITHVIKGKLFFETLGEIICVNQGEVIAIPSDVEHAVFTRDDYVQAIDAWSPVMEQYKS